MEHLFVYGTLRRGSNNEFAWLLSEQAQFMGAARVPGRLYDFGRYPGAVKSDQPTQWINGEVFRLNNPRLLTSLDEYEGPDFERAMVSATDHQGHTLDCWIYWYVGAAQGRLIESGDWFNR